MKITIRNCAGKSVAELLEAAGAPLDLRCGGTGTCGRCLVRLLAGRYRVGNDTVEADKSKTVRACRTWLLGDQGEIDVPDSSIVAGRGSIAAGWRGAPLPVRPETVIGIDLGTTTVAAVKVTGGAVVARASTFNRQNRCGDNVVTRISHAGKSAAGLEELRRAAVDSIDELLGELGAADAVRIAIAGNTVMSSLLHGIDPTPIGVMPFTPPCRIFPVKTARELGFSVPGDIPVLTVPAIAGYVGGDLTAGLGEVGLGPGEMLVDIGTNCEIIFQTPRGCFCTAAAAGPAFEGAGIRCGRRATAGAIDHYFGVGRFTVLGAEAPTGMCGSAMIDFLAVACREGRLNEFGRLVPSASSCEIAPGISIDEEEIEQLLKAKAAVHAGIATLAAYCKTPVTRIFLAGGFAQYLDSDNAVAAGMLPDCAFEVVGNTSLGGAARLAVDPGRMAELERLIDLPTDLPLNTLPDFEDYYIDGLMLPQNRRGY